MKLTIARILKKKQQNNAIPLIIFTSNYLQSHSSTLLNLIVFDQFDKHSAFHTSTCLVFTKTRTVLVIYLCYYIHRPRLHLYSGHDSTLMPLLVSLGIFDHKWPPFTADLTLELYTTPEKDIYVKISYNNEVKQQYSVQCTPNITVNIAS